MIPFQMRTERSSFQSRVLSHPAGTLLALGGLPPTAVHTAPQSQLVRDELGGSLHQTVC